jgi:4-hydroxy-3-polyprenylbenzoate decarboxylase
MKSYVVAISGASGSIYGIRLVEELLKCSFFVHLCVSHTAFSIIKMETGFPLIGKTESDTGKKIQKHFASGNVTYHPEHNLAAPFSSGSFITEGMLCKQSR